MRKKVWLSFLAFSSTSSFVGCGVEPTPRVESAASEDSQALIRDDGLQEAFQTNDTVGTVQTNDGRICGATILDARTAVTAEGCVRDATTLSVRLTGARGAFDSVNVAQSAFPYAARLLRLERPLNNVNSRFHRRFTHQPLTTANQVCVGSAHNANRWFNSNGTFAVRAAGTWTALLNIGTPARMLEGDRGGPCFEATGTSYTPAGMITGTWGDTGIVSGGQAFARSINQHELYPNYWELPRGFLRNQGSRECVGYSQPGEVVWQNACNNYTKYRLVTVGAAVSLVSEATGLCLVAQANPRMLTEAVCSQNVQSWTPSGDIRSGFVSLRATNLPTAECLDVPFGTAGSKAMQTHPCHGGASQLFKLEN